MRELVSCRLAAFELPAMSRALRLLVLLSLVSCLPAGTAPAHHTFVTKYDGAKVVTISGVVTSVSYSNPHITFEVQSGATTWTVETESIPVALGKGLIQNILKEGAKVTCTGWKARDGSAALGLKSVTVAGGSTITMRRTAR